MNSASQAGSGQELRNDLTINIGQAIVTPLRPVGQPGVIQPQQMQDGGLEVMNVNRILNHMKAQVVGGAQGLARLDPAAGQPHARDMAGRAYFR